MEQLDVTPVAQPSVTSYKVAQLNIGTEPPCIDVTVRDNTGGTKTVTYNGDMATTMLGQLNRGNFSVTSLQRAIINRLVADGHLPAGTVSGSAQ